MTPLYALAVVLQAASSSEVPLPVRKGIVALEAGRCADAFREWSKDWTGPEAPASAEQLRGSCQLLTAMGKLHSYEVLRIVRVGARVARVYMVLLYEKQPVYLMVVTHRPVDEWKTLAVNWHTVADRVLPSEIVPQERPTLVPPN